MLNTSPKVAGLLIVAASLVAGCGSSPDEVAKATGDEPTSTEAEPREVPSDRAGIVAMAQRAAIRTGEESPTGIEWVYASREDAVRHIANDSLAGTEGVETLVVQMQGQFEVAGARVPPAGEGHEPSGPPSGKALVIVVDLATGITTDRIVLPAPADLAVLGNVTTG